jgi:hypothetical protein
MSLSFSKWKTPEHSLVLVVITIAITMLAATAMLPNTEEKAQVLLSQGRVDDAIALYESRRAVASLNPFEAYSLATIYAGNARTFGLAGLLEEEIAIRPDSIWALDMLLPLYRHRGENANEARVLLRIFTHAPKESDFRRLITLYRLLGDREGERSTLERAKAQNMASTEDLERLRYLTSPNLAPAAVWRAADAPIELE